MLRGLVMPASRFSSGKEKRTKPVKIERQNTQINEAELWKESGRAGFLCDKSGVILSANNKLSRYYRKKPSDLIGSNISSLFIDGRLPDKFKNSLNNTRENGVTESFNLEINGGDKSRTLRFILRNLSSEPDKVYIEIKNDNRIERVQNHAEVLRTLLDKIAKPVLEIDSKLTVLRHNESLETLIRDNQVQVQGNSLVLDDLFEERELMRIKNGIEILSSNHGSEVSFHGKLPSSHPLYLKAQLIAFDTYPAETFILIITDLTSDTLNQKWIEYLAYFDNLTGLPNLFWLEETVPQLIKQHSTNDSKFGLALFDINGFNQINAGLGHKIGDRALASMAARLRKAMHNGSMSARWSGDKFVVIFPQQKTEDDILEACEKIMLASSNPIIIENMELNFSFNIGLSVYPEDGQNIEELFNSANKAMTYGKGQLRNHLQLFSSMPSNAKTKNELPMRNMLREALREKQIKAFFQPKYDAKTRKIYGYEALARWQKNDEFISPSEFIPIAEKTGMIDELGDQIMRQALEFAVKLQEIGSPLNVAVNVSLRQLYSGRFLDHINRETTELKLPRDLITLEITESISLYDISDTLKRLNKLREAGYTISIDDFGTGYSSLSQLNDMPVQELKIDYSFIKNVNNPQGEKIVQAILMLANTFQLSTVAEGIEDEKTADKLTAMGVDILQGFFFSKAVNETNFLKLLD
jgi:diguanylate cyclase (GGDEF)-like protein